MTRIFTLFACIFLAGFTAAAQTDDRGARDLLQRKYAAFGLTAADVAELAVTDSYTSGGIHHVYVGQRHQELPVVGAQAALHFRGRQLVASSHSFQSLPSAQPPPPAPAVSAPAALRRAATKAGLTAGPLTELPPVGKRREFLLGAATAPPATVQLAYFPERGALRLAWEIEIDRHAESAAFWLTYVDARTGEVLDQDNLVLHCEFGGNPPPAPATAPRPAATATAKSADGARYHVFPFGVESPLHGARRYETDPADAAASPFGWHDIDGLAGPDFTYTRGNNVYAYLDRDDEANSPDSLLADGGDELDFDFYYATGAEPDTIARAAMTQLFYTNNRLHDWLFHAGFDEASGNFQRRNYSGQGEGRDHVLAEAQDGESRNNANFFTPKDGSSGIMQMYLWDSPSTRMRVTTGGSGVEGSYVTGIARFGPPISDSPLTGELVIARDDSSAPTLVCNPATNTGELAGKIALITRGTCTFEKKVHNAQTGGAIAAIVCNHLAENEPEGGTNNMADSDEDLDVTIPSLFLSREACAPLQLAVAAGETVTAILQNFTSGLFDGDFDNGIVAHEYGHGVSIRLVGGPGNVRCLTNDEQMGEGWSDFFAVASTPQTNLPDPDGREPRGIGNFVRNGAITDIGIRSQPYSTDLSVNGKTLHNIISDNITPENPPSAHDVGETWAAVLLDLYWRFVDRDGLDPDLITGTGGNNFAVKLVVEGMKYTRCKPGFLDGRDGILQADEILTGGKNHCLIWEVFARRGLGFSADQGDRDDRTDNVEAFDLSPYCIGGVQLTKTADTTTIRPGDVITYTLRATSYRPGLTRDVTIRDLLPAGATLVPGSVRGIADWTRNGDELTFPVGTLEFDTDATITYRVATDPQLASAQLFFDDVESGDDNWDLVNATGNILWELNDTLPYSGNVAWFVPNVANEQNQILTTFAPVPLTGSRPALRFFTQYDTEPRWDGGIIEVSTDGTNWQKVDDRIVRGRYRGGIAAQGTAALQGIASFWGKSKGYQEIIVDLTAYANQSVHFRFHWFSDVLVGGRGWWIDDIEVIDAMRYATAATLTSAAGDEWVAEMPEFGVLVESSIVNDTYDPQLGKTTVTVFPNPASAYANVVVDSERGGRATIALLGVDGRRLHEEVVQLLPGSNRTVLATDRLPAGVYLVQVRGEANLTTTKLTVR